MLNRSTRSEQTPRPSRGLRGGRIVCVSGGNQAYWSPYGGKSSILQADVGIINVRPSFLFVTCQAGANAALKAEFARLWPDLKFAFSRPGFLTFKIPDEHRLQNRLELGSVFARSSGYSLGQVQAETADQRSLQAWELAAGDQKFHALHVWPRDAVPVGQRDFEPGPTAESTEAQQTLLTHAPALVRQNLETEQALGRGQTVLDCILIEPDRWWLGYHRVDDFASHWPGGVMPIELPATAVSRAYLKMEEALAWSRLPIETGDVCVEVGSAPGGASQALLNRGLIVNGIDPAKMHPAVLAHPNFHHLRARGADLKRREFSGVQWLMADMNVAPSYTLDTVEAIVMHPQVHIRGVILTLKLLEWKLADEVTAWCERVRGWGFRDVRARQLAHNRQEICLTALKHRSLRRLGRKPTLKSQLSQGGSPNPPGLSS